VSSTSGQTNYDLYIDLERDESQATTSLTIPGGLGLSDTQVLDFVQYLRAYSWPAGMASRFSVTKWDQTTITYTTDMAADPPAFT